MGAQDPRTKFKTSDYEKQEQELPGLQSELTPQPDCGETSYEGHNRLLDYKMLVTGGDSAIGRAAAIAYAKEGADVAINYLPSEEQDAQEVKAVIEKAGRKAVLIPGDIRDEQFNYDLVEQAYKELGGLDNVTLVAGHQQYHDKLEEFDTQSLKKRLKQTYIQYSGQFKKHWTIYNLVHQSLQHHPFKVIIQIH